MTLGFCQYPIRQYFPTPFGRLQTQMHIFFRLRSSSFSCGRINKLPTLMARAHFRLNCHCVTLVHFFPPNISPHLYFSILSPSFKYAFNNKTTSLLSLMQHHHNTQGCPYLISSLLNHRHTHTQMQTYNMSPHSCVHSTCCIILSLHIRLTVGHR